LPDPQGDQKRRVEDVNRAPRRLADRAECGRAMSPLVDDKGCPVGDRVVQRERAGALYSWVSQYTLADPGLQSRCDTVSSAIRQNRPALSGAGTGGRDAHHRARCVTPSRSDRTAIAKFARSRQRGARDVDTFDATLAEPVVGYGGVVCDESPKQRFEAIRDATRQDSLAWCHCLVRGVGWLSNALDEDDQQEDDDG
jgi:hypothetical protein